MTYFVVSDIHSFYKSCRSALSINGFNPRNKNHTLIVCGDIFDRGEDSLGVYKFLMRIPKKRRILIRGNHEDLFMSLLNKKYPEGHDFSNMTVNTFCQIAQMEKLKNGGDMVEYLEDGYCVRYGMMDDREYIDPLCQETWNIIKDKVAKSDVVKWLKSKEWKDYFELDKFIFVHSFIPLTNLYGFGNPPITAKGQFEYRPTWRDDATIWEWEVARWGCPWRKYQEGYFNKEMEQGKVLVCGHWSSSDFHEVFEQDYTHNYSIYYGDGIIALDGGVWHFRGTSGLFHPQNVLIIENGEIVK